MQTVSCLMSRALNPVCVCVVFFTSSRQQQHTSLQMAKSGQVSVKCVVCCTFSVFYVAKVVLCVVSKLNCRPYCVLLHRIFFLISSSSFSLPLTVTALIRLNHNSEFTNVSCSFYGTEKWFNCF